MGRFFFVLPRGLIAAPHFTFEHRRPTLLFEREGPIPRHVQVKGAVPIFAGQALYPNLLLDPADARSIRFGTKDRMKWENLLP